MSNRAILYINLKWLVESLNLPEGTEILGAEYGLDYPKGLKLLVDHPSLPEVRDGKAIPSYRCYFEQGKATLFNRWEEIKGETS